MKASEQKMVSLMPWTPHSDNPWERPRPPRGEKSSSHHGSPDLEEILKKLTRFFRSSSPTPKPGRGILAGTILIFGMWLASGFYTVKEAEQAVILRFGRYVETVGSGLRYHLPYPVEEVFKRNVAVNNYIRSDERAAIIEREQQDFYMLTGDENLVELNKYTILWRIKDLKKFLFNVRSPEAVILATADSALREVVARTPINLIITEKRAQVNEDVTTLLQHLLDHYDLGIHIVEFLMQKADPPEPVLDAFLDVTRAEADRERSQHEARAYRDEILPKARAQAKNMTLAAEGYAKEVIAKSEGEAGRFSSVLTEYQKAPEVTQTRLYMETMEHVLSNANKMIIDPAAQAPVHPYMPLPQLQPKSQGGEKQ